MSDVGEWVLAFIYRDKKFAYYQETPYPLLEPTSTPIMVIKIIKLGIPDVVFKIIFLFTFCKMKSICGCVSNFFPISLRVLRFLDE